MDVGDSQNPDLGGSFRPILAHFWLILAHFWLILAHFGLILAQADSGGRPLWAFVKGTD